MENRKIWINNLEVVENCMTLFYRGKSLFTCNRRNHGKLKPKCDVPREHLPWEKPFTVVCVTAPNLIEGFGGKRDIRVYAITLTLSVSPNPEC